MTVYDYTKSGAPCLCKIKYDVANSAIAASIVDIYDAVRSVDEETLEVISCSFKIEMSDTLSIDDESALEAIIDASLDLNKTNFTVKSFLRIVNACEDGDMKTRILDMLTSYPTIETDLDVFDFPSAKSTIDSALVAEDITQADHDFLDGVIPEAKWI